MAKPPASRTSPPPSQPSNTVALESLLPRWTSYVSSNSIGRDPLGLTRVSARITDFLLTGIITTTERARYYSFYCWALWHIQQEDKASTFRQFADGLRRREAALALATFCHDNEASFVGYNATNAQQLDPTTQSYSMDFRVLPSNALGGYGQYYNGCLQRLGLVNFNRSRVDTVTPGFAEELARSVQRTLEKTSYIQKRIFADKNFGLPELKKSCERLEVNALHLPETKSERDQLIDLFFGWANIPAEHAEAQRERILRRHTLTQMLHIVGCYEAKELTVDANRLDWQLLYAPTYYSALCDRKKHVAYKKPDELAACRGLWRQFCLHQYLTRALELLLQSMLQLLGNAPDGLTLPEVVASAISSDFHTFLRGVIGNDCPSPQLLLCELGVDETQSVRTCAAKRQDIGSQHAWSEGNVLTVDVSSPASRVAQACFLLAVLYAKWRYVTVEDDPAWFEVGIMAGGEPWAGTILPFLDEWLQPEMTWRECVTNVLQRHVVKRHELVRMRRRKGAEAAWLQQRGDLLFKGHDFEPVWRSSRHINVFKILCDLHLLNHAENGLITLTCQGENVLSKALAEARREGGRA